MHDAQGTSAIAAVTSNSQPFQDQNTQDSDSDQPLKLRQNRGKKRSLKHQNTRESVRGQEASNKRRRTKDLSAAFNRGDRGYKAAVKDHSKKSGGQRQGDNSDIPGTPKRFRKTRIVVELPRNSSFKPEEYFHMSLNSQQSGSQQHSPPPPPQISQSFGHNYTHNLNSRNDEQRVIPDSQEVSSFSVSSQNLGEVAITTQQGSRHQQPESSTHPTTTTEIPSRQPDRRFTGSFYNPSISGFVVETDPGKSQTAAAGISFDFLTQESLDPNFIPPTSQLSDEHISATSVSQDRQQSTNNNQAFPEQSNSQPAQVVVPLSSHQGGLASQSQPDFTVYDDDDLSIPDTVLAKSQTQHFPPDSSQALSELDDNTRNTSSSTGHVPEPQVAPGRTGVIQNHSDKSVYSVTAEEPEPPLEQSTFVASDHTTNHPSPTGPRAVSEDMDGASPHPTRVSAHERLRLIRERGFASLSEPPVDPAKINQAGAKAETAPASHTDVQEAPPADVTRLSPLTSVPLTTAVFVEKPHETTQSEPSSNEHQALVLETMQEPVGQDKQAELNLDDHAPVEVDFSVQNEQPATLDPSNLTLSIEHDMDISPSIPTDEALPPNLQIPDDLAMPIDEHEPEDAPPSTYPKSLLPQVPTGNNEYLITLPFQSSSRPVYNDILRDNEELIREFNSSFLTLPHGIPHPTTVSKLDEMFSRLFDVCDLPPFMDTISSITPAEVTRYLINTNAKFAFLDELLARLTEAESDTKILIIARPGQVMDLLGHLIQTRGYRYIRSGLEIVGPSAAQHQLTVAISATTDSPSSIAEDADVVIAFDHTYRQELLSSSLRDRSPILLVLTIICSIQHLNMRISESLEPLERNNVLVLALVRAMRYVEDAERSTVPELENAAELFSNLIHLPHTDDFYWEPQRVPEDVFEDMYASSTQGLASLPSLHAFGTEHLPGSRKRSHDVSRFPIYRRLKLTWQQDEDDEGSFKRLRISQPTVVTNMSHISDSLKSLIGDDITGNTPKASLSVSVDKLEMLSAKVSLAVLLGLYKIGTD